MFVSDLRHFLDLPPDVSGPALRMADHLSRLVRAATAADAGFVWVSALTCSRRPGRRPCPGHMLLLRTDVPPSIEWKCTSCGNDGVISGWERSPFDLRPRAEDQADSGIDAREVVIDPEVAATLRTLLLLDTAAERLVYRAEATEQGVVLAGDEDAFEELIESVAAEANHEQERRRQKRLDAAFDALSQASGR